ncbi:MAG: PBP1A family penicillin-binding protein [Spirochaetes bacterium]|nr:PBP1A family penicillin-binding protein [Spirochaetota bacterium]
MHADKTTSFGKFFISCFFVSSLVGGLIFGYIFSEINNFSEINDLKQFQPSVPTKVYDVNGILIAELFKEKRDLISFSEIPQTLINAFLATEDQEFYHHFGINPMAIIRAMVKNIQAGDSVQGGSTITQQLAKRLFTESEKSYARKAKEAIISMQIEQKYSKEEILEMYFNQIYLGHGCYGVSSAADLFFGKKVKYLSAAEASVLAALPSAPGRYSPLMNTHDAYEKNVDILNRMVKEKYLTREHADEIYRDFWPAYIDSIMTEYPTKTAYTKIEDRAPYFTNYIRQILVTRFGSDTVYNEGLNVYTTLNLKNQELAQEVITKGLAEQDKISSQENKYYNTALDRSMFNTYSLLRTIFSLPGVIIKQDLETKVRKQIIENVSDSLDALALFADSANVQNTIEDFRSSVALDVSSSLTVEGALVSLDHRTGYITTMVGGSGFKVDNQLNRAVMARRQPGSSFKPFIYGAGIESKIITSMTAIPDAPMVNIDSQGDTWEPGNYEGTYEGLLRVRKALIKSVNIISIRIYDMVGPDRIVKFASKMLKVPEFRFNPNPSLALGTAELTPMEMAGGYAVYANRGRDVIPFAIRYILDRDDNEIANIEEEIGNIIAMKEKAGTMQIISPAVAFIMTSLMEDVVTRGTASAIRSEFQMKMPAAGKTGTTSNWTDAWFCGFTPEMVTIVWMGYDKPFLSLGKHQSGGEVAVPLWAKYMKEVYKDIQPGSFAEMPKGVYRGGGCEYTGLAPSPTCRVVGDYFLNGTGVSGRCDGNHEKMQSVIERYMEQQGIAIDEQSDSNAE